MLTMTALALAAFALAATSGTPAPPPSQVELAGFQLGQYESAAACLGTPASSGTKKDGKNWSAYPICDSASLILQSRPDGRSRTITAISVFGRPCARPVALLGVGLGSTKDELLKTFGAPSRVRREEDRGVAYDFVEYADRNYSFETTVEGTVRSIQISGSTGFPPRPEGLADLGDFKRFRTAVLARDVAAMSTLLAPDFEIFLDSKVVRYEGPAAEAFETNPPLRDAVFGAGPKSLANNFLKDGEDPAIELRVTERAGSYPVMKFRGGSVRELAWKYSRGAWRVWEIRFR